MRISIFCISFALGYPLFEKICDAIGEKFAETKIVQFLAAAIPVGFIGVFTAEGVKRNKHSSISPIDDNPTNEPTVPDGSPISQKLRHAHDKS